VSFDTQVAQRLAQVYPGAVLASRERRLAHSLDLPPATRLSWARLRTRLDPGRAK
jgi:hypothetical protein